MKWTHTSMDLFGLNGTEVQILESLSSTKSVQVVAKETGLSRTGIKYSISNLMHKGLINLIRQGKRKLYIAITEDQLRQKLQQTMDSIVLESGVKEGVRIKTSIEDEFIIHVGPKEIVPAFKRIAYESKDERIKAIQHHRSFNDQVEVATSEQVADFNNAIIKNHIILDGLLNESAYESYVDEIKTDPKKFKEGIQSLEGRMADYSVFPNNRFNYHSEIWLFKTTTLIINWKDSVAIEIINKNMTGFLREMFEYVKEGSRKIDHNKIMREIIVKNK